MRLGGGRGRFGSQGKPCQVFQEAVFGRSQVAQSRLPGCPSQTKESKHGQRDAVERKKLQQVRVLEARASRKETSPQNMAQGLCPCWAARSVPTAAPGPSFLQPTRLAPRKPGLKDPRQREARGRQACPS